MHLINVINVNCTMIVFVIAKIVKIENQ